MQRQARLGRGLEQLEPAVGAHVFVHEGGVLAEAGQARIGGAQSHPLHRGVQGVQRRRPLRRKGQLDRPLEDSADAGLLGGPRRRVGLVEGAAEQQRDVPAGRIGGRVRLARRRLADRGMRAESDVCEVVLSVDRLNRLRVTLVDGQDGRVAGAAVQPLHVGEGVVDVLDHVGRAGDLSDRAPFPVAPFAEQGEGMDQRHGPSRRLASQRRRKVWLGRHVEDHWLEAARGESLLQTVAEDAQGVVGGTPLDQDDAHGLPPQPV